MANSKLLKELAEATGKSIDEIMEYFGRKGGQAPGVPIGSGKNLEALQQAKIGAPSLERTYPKRIVQDELAAKGGFTLEGSPYSKDFTMPHPEATVPTVRGSTIPQSVVPEVVEEVGETLPATIARRADDVIPAQFDVIPSSKTPDMSTINRMNPYLKPFGIMAGLGAGAYVLSPDDEDNIDQPPLSNDTVNKENGSVLPSNYMDLAQEEALNQSIVSPARKKVTSAASSAPEKTPEEEYDFVRQMIEAQKMTGDNQFMNALLRAGTQAGAAIAGLGAGANVKADYSGVDALDKTADRQIQNVKGIMETKSAEHKLKSAERDLQDDTKLRDPNSSISKLVKDVLARHGLKVNSAKEAQNAGINVQNIILQEMASKDRKELAEMELKVKNKNKEIALDDKQRKFAQTLRKELTTGTLGKQYATFATGQRMSNALAEFAKDPSGYSDYATLMGGLKSLQGDESVVREAEVRMGMSATSLFDSLQNQLQKAATGKMLQPSQREAMIKTIKTLTDLSKQQYMQSAAPILEQAEMEGIPSSMLLSGSLSGARSAPTETITTSKKIARKQYSASRDQTKIIYDDGSEEIVNGKP